MRDIRGLVLATALTALACTRPLSLNVPKTDVVAAPPTDSSGRPTETSVVEVRYFPFSPTVSVVGWSSDDAGFGLRSWLRRDGSLVRDHRLYVSAYYLPGRGSYYLASVPPVQFEREGRSRDLYACYFGKCSPFQTLGWRVPDDFLRASRDSLTVTLYGRDGRKLDLTVRRQLIDAYLAKVDSVSATLRRSN
jgi:hypothetical protein